MKWGTGLSDPRPQQMKIRQFGGLDQSQDSNETNQGLSELAWNFDIISGSLMRCAPIQAFTLDTNDTGDVTPGTPVGSSFKPIKAKPFTMMIGNAAYNGILALGTTKPAAGDEYFDIRIFLSFMASNLESDEADSLMLHKWFSIKGEFEIWAGVNLSKKNQLIFDCIAYADGTVEELIFSDGVRTWKWDGSVTNHVPDAMELLYTAEIDGKTVEAPAGYLELYAERVWAAHPGTQAEYFSDDMNPGNWTVGLEAAGWAMFPTWKDDGVVNLWAAFDGMLLFKNRSLFITMGETTDNFYARQLSRTDGAINADCIGEYQGMIYFLSENGLWYFDGTQIHAVSLGKVQKLFDAWRSNYIFPEQAYPPMMCIWQDRLIIANIFIEPTSVNPELEKYAGQWMIELNLKTKVVCAKRFQNTTNPNEPDNPNAGTSTIPLTAMIVAPYVNAGANFHIELLLVVVGGAIGPYYTGPMQQDLTKWVYFKFDNNTPDAWRIDFHWETPETDFGDSKSFKFLGEIAITGTGFNNIPDMGKGTGTLKITPVWDGKAKMAKTVELPWDGGMKRVQLSGSGRRLKLVFENVDGDFVKIDDIDGSVYYAEG